MDQRSDAFISTPRTSRARPGLYRYLATSESPLPRRMRFVRRWLHGLSVPAPRIIIHPLLWIYLLFRGCYLRGIRLFVCEPLFKAYCKQYGRRLRTGTFIHWVMGKGDIIVGDDVRIDGKCLFNFAARFSDRPVLLIGDNTGIGHNCRFVVGRQIAIGRNCTLSGDIEIFDSNGHPTDPLARLERRPPAADDVRPVTIGDGVWIGRHCLIFPGVRIGDGSVISAGSVVRSHVPPFSVVAGNPARVVFKLRREAAVSRVPAKGAGIHS